jgi:predicted AlkP superfamily pyrophosphatase or phosphodiesterase
VVLPTAFGGSGLTEAAYGGARFCGVSPGEDYAPRLLEELRAGPGLVYGYLADLDTAAHVFGIDSPQWHSAAAAADALLSRIAEGLPPDAALLVTADHGGLNIAGQARIDLDADERLSAGVSVVAGEPRVRYLHTRAGAVPDVLDTWRAVLGGQAEVLSREEAIARDLFGVVPDVHRPRIGDVVVICTADVAVLATAHEPPELAKLVGFHGGLTPAETAIPLITLLP